ncbi:MAG: Na/Pi cotransporter family protein [Candidatus Rifleibacteriota bacterium]
MLNKKIKRTVKLSIKWAAFVVFIFTFFYLHYFHGKEARDTFAVFAGGLGMFVFGMHLMSSSLQRIAGSRLKTIVSTLTSSRFAGMLTGLGVTALIQSSSATTVMTVGFVNAGLMSLKQSVGIILGANIGTTVTAQLIAFKLTDLAWPVLAIGSAMLVFSKSRKNRSWGEALIGFALLFLGMKFMGDTLKAYRDHELFRSTFVLLSQHRLLGVLAGIIVTMIVQSSSATVGLTMSLIGTGAFGDDPLIALKAAIPIILGDNIGTCVTAALASIGASRNGQRAALIHSLFNTLGTLILLPFIDYYARFILSTSPEPMRQVANAHSFFNITNGLLFLPFAGLLEKTALFVLPRNEEEQEADSTNLDKRILATPPIAIAQAEKQLKASIKLVKKKFVRIEDLLLNQDQNLDEVAAAASVIESLHKQRAQINKELNKFLVSLAQKDLSEDMTRQVTRLLYLNKDLEILSSQLNKLITILLDNAEENQTFSLNIREELHLCLSKTREVFEQLTANLQLGEEEAQEIRNCIYSQGLLDKAARSNHLDRIKSGKYNPVEGITCLDALRSTGSMLSSMQYICDHLLFKF